MSSLRQIDANRRNAQLSTGPRSPEGKQASSRNALRSGIFAQAEIIPGESPEELAELAAEHFADHNPQTAVARDLVDSLIRHAWLLRRLSRIEAAFFTCDCEQCQELYSEAGADHQGSGRYSRELRKFDVLQKRINATERNYHRTLKALQNLPSSAPIPISQNEPNSPETPTESIVRGLEVVSRNEPDFPQPPAELIAEPAALAPDDHSPTS